MNPTCIEDMFRYVLLPDPNDTREQYTFFKEDNQIRYQYTTKTGKKYQEYYYNGPQVLFSIVRSWTILRPINESNPDPVHAKIAELGARFAQRKKAVTAPTYVVEYNSW